MTTPGGLLATLDPSFIQTLIDRATATLSRELGYWLGLPKELKETGPARRPVIWLNNEPLAEPAPVVERSSYPTDPWDLIPDTDYVIEGRKLLLGWGWRYGDIRVTYWGGYDPAGVLAPLPPAELSQVVRQMVLASLDSEGLLGTNSGDLKSETIGDYSYTRADLVGAALAMGEDWNTIARKWRRLRL